MDWTSRQIEHLPLSSRNTRCEPTRLRSTARVNATGFMTSSVVTHCCGTLDGKDASPVTSTCHPHPPKGHVHFARERAYGGRSDRRRPTCGASDYAIATPIGHVNLYMATTC